MNYRILSLFLILFPSLSIFAQDNSQKKNWLDEEKKNTFKISQTSFAANTFLLGYERSVGKFNSLQLYVSATAYKKNNGSLIDEEKSIFGGSAELQFRTYLLPRERNLKGLYATPYVKYQSIKIKNVFDNTSYNGTSTFTYTTVEDYYINSFSGGVIIGYQFIFSNIIVLDLYAGGGVKVSDSNKKTSILDEPPFIFFPNYTGVSPKAGIKIGVAF